MGSSLIISILLFGVFVFQVGLAEDCDSLMSMCARFKAPSLAISYDYFKTAVQKFAAFEPLRLNFRFTPPCTNPNDLRLFHFPSDAMGGPVTQWSPSNNASDFKYDPSGIFANYYIVNASFANAGNYTAYCASNSPLAYYREGKPVSVFIKVKPQILYVDVVGADWPGIDQHLDVRQTLSHFLRDDDDPRKMAQQFSNNLTALGDLLTLTLNPDHLPNLLTDKVKVRFYGGKDDVRILRFHVGTGYYGNNERGEFWVNETVLAKMTQTRTECNCDPVAPQKTSFSVRNFPNGTTYRYELPLSKIYQKNPNNCSIDLQTSAFMKSDRDVDHNVTFKLLLEYSPQNVTIQVTNFGDGSCLVECLASSSCPPTYREATIDVFQATSRDSKNDEPVFRSYSLLVPDTDGRLVISGRRFDSALCRDFNGRSAKNVKIVCSLTNDADLTTRETWPGESQYPIAIIGDYVARTWPPLEWWVILLIVLTCLFFVVILIGIICFVGYVEKAKTTRRGDNQMTSQFQGSYSCRGNQPVFTTLGRASNNSSDKARQQGSNCKQADQLPRTASPEASFSFYDNDAYSACRMATPSPARFNSNRSEAVV